MKPYGLIADLHAHSWSAFSSLDSQGRNTRLMSICHEIDRCCEETLKAGGNRVVFAGDLFHTRGSVEPAVFNPIKDCLSRNITKGIDGFHGIPGNHDLASKESNELGSSVAMLGDQCIHWYHQWHASNVLEPRLADRQPIVFAPWVSDPTCYLATIEELASTMGGYVKVCDLICHIGIDGTLSSMPPHGVTPEKLKALGFKRVFSGHYHHHKDFGDGIYSIGATTHQTWSDVGTKAGFMLVHPTSVQWFASHAPSFVDLDGTESAEDLPLIVDGHFVRAKIGEADVKKVQEWRENLLEMGAKGVIIQALPPSTAAKRAGVSAKSLSAIDKSVTDYVAERKMPAVVATICADVLAAVRGGV